MRHARYQGNYEKEQELHKVIQKKARKDKRDWLKERLQQTIADPDTKTNWKGVKQLRHTYKPRHIKMQQNGKTQPFQKRAQIIADHLRDAQWGKQDYDKDTQQNWMNYRIFLKQR